MEERNLIDNNLSSALNSIENTSLRILVGCLLGPYVGILGIVVVNTGRNDGNWSCR